MRGIEKNFSTILLVLTFVICMGCGSSSPDTFEVEGVVRLDGKPLTSGVITFTPAEGRSATGFIQSDGTFTLKTFHDGDGALPGKHTVTVTPGGSGPTAKPNFDSDRPALATNSPIPAKYGIPGVSGLEFEVKTDEANHVEFDLQSN